MDHPSDDAARPPRCSTCGYILLGLAEARCPECGTPFDPTLVENASLRERLLPWERAEFGGAIPRLTKTLLAAWFHPTRYFDAVAVRKTTRVANARTLIALGLVVALFFYMVASAVDSAGFFLRLLMKGADAGRAARVAADTVYATLPLDCEAWASQVSASAAIVLTVSFLLGRAFGQRFESLRTQDIAAVCFPVVPAETLVMACMMLIASQTYVMDFVLFGALASILLRVIFWGFVCRRVLALSRWATAGVLVLCSVFVFVIGAGVSFVFEHLVRAVLA